MQINNKSTSITRNKLYKKVWDKPMLHLAKEYGLSDVGLAKICIKHKIPRPPVGYWAKKEFGKNVTETPLPDIDDEALENILIRIDNMGRRNVPDSKIFEKILSVQAVPVEPHEWVVRTEKSLKGSRPDSNGLIRPKTKQCLDVHVGKNSISRAMAIMDALLKALENECYCVELEDTETDRSIRVRIEEEMLSITLDETLDKKEIELSAAQKREKEKYSWMSSRKEYEYFPSGKLRLSIGRTMGSNYRRVWCDGIKQQLEDMLGSFIQGLLKSAEITKIERLKHEKRVKEQEEQQRLERKREVKRQNEKAALETLLQEVKYWHESQRIRQFLKALETRAKELLGRIDEGSPLQEWLNWAHNQADRFDPLLPGGNSPLDYDTNLDSWYGRETDYTNNVNIHIKNATESYS